MSLFGRTRVPPYISIGVPAIVGFTGVAYYYSLEEVIITKRKRVLATTDAWERRLGDREYKRLLKYYKSDILPSNHRATRTVTRVGSRIASSASELASQNRIMTKTHPSTDNVIQKPKFTFTVVRSDTANAFVLPNNHVFVMTGLFRFVKDEDELASVLGHELAHNLARHAGERMSGSWLFNLLARMTYLVDPSGVLYTLFVPAVTLLHQLPHSREHEMEADHIGLYLAANACYDPRAAKRVFTAMKHHEHQQEEGKSFNRNLQSPPEFMSTHPSYDTRLDQFDVWMPKALQLYRHNPNQCQKIRNDMALARQQAAILATNEEQQ